MKTLKLILITLLVCFYASLKAQTPPNLPAVLPPSPAIANFNRYGEIPIDYSTGVPNISIPIYTAKSRQLELPINLSYHASGIKVEDKASIVGLGWVLNAGGYIGVTRLGGGGENQSRYEGLTFHTSAEFERMRDSTAALQPPPETIIGMGTGILTTPFFNFGYLIELEKQALTTGWQSDKYNFVLPDGESGTFRYDFHTGQLFVLPYSNIKVASSGSGYTITDEKGITYTFNLPTNYNPLTENSMNWNITSIVSADKTDTIRFVYKSQQNIYTTPNFVSSIECGAYDSYNTLIGNGWGSYNLYQYNNNSISAITAALESILDSVVTSTTVIKFTVAGDRQEQGWSTAPYRMSNISIYNRSTNALIKSYTLNNNSYFGSAAGQNQRLKLAGISVSGNDMAAVENYSFVYDEDYQMAPYPEVLEGSSAAQFREDYWGYDNGNAGRSLVPIQMVPNPVADGEFGGPVTLQPGNAMDRTPNPTYAHINMLEEIHYPTGGKTVFTFEPNVAYLPYWNVTEYGTGSVVGGFRIKSIQNYADNFTLTDYKSYEYTLGHTRLIEPDLYSFNYRVCATSSESGSLYYYENSRHVINSSPFLPLTVDNGPPVFYDSVTEYIGDATGNTGKTVYSYVTPPAMPAAKFITPFDLPIYRDAGEMDYGNYIPHLDNKVTYKYSGGSYIPVNKVQNTYTNYLSDKVYYTGIHSTLITLYEPSGTWADDYAWSAYNYAGVLISSTLAVNQEYPYYYYMTDLHSTQQTPLLTQSVNYDYSPDGSRYLASTTNYTYANAVTGASLLVHLQPTQKTVSSSTGDTYITNMKYPSDFFGGTYIAMLAKNILYPVIQQLNYKNTTANFLNSVTTNYNMWTSDIIAPQTVQTQTGSASPETRITYAGYDAAANVQTVSKTGGPPVSYIWGYNESYPVAQVTNAPINDVYYEGFESAGGNSARDDAKTGHYSATGLTKSLSGLDAGTYTLSYWQKSGGVWTYQSSNVTVTGSTYLIYITGQVDDVRFCPANAEMVTYTYDPSIGITSTTDAKGEITYYEYDTFSRLKNIRDKDKNIIKSMCYNYQGGTAGCFLPTPAPQPFVYARIEETGYGSSTSYNGEGGQDTYTTANLSVKFYSDASCTVPYTLPANMTIQVNDNFSGYNDMAGTTVHDAYVNTYTVTAGSSSFSLGAATLSWQHSYFDSYSNWWDDYDSWDYELALYPGSNYTVL